MAKSLTEIATGNKKSNELIREIAAACSEQAQGIEQVNVAVSQMDQVTQSNAANAEESASASEQLSAQALELNSMVQQLAAMVGGANAASATSAGTSPAAKVYGGAAAQRAASAGVKGSGKAAAKSARAGLSAEHNIKLPPPSGHSSKDEFVLQESEEIAKF